MLRRRAAPILTVFGLLLVPLGARAQEETPAGPSNGEVLRVFLDCRSRYCDFDHFRREIPFVNYVRDRRDAQVHILVTTRGTGGGGIEFTLDYIGQQDFEGIDEQLLYFTSETDTRDEIRAGLTRTLSLGLVRYVARTPLAEQLELVYEAADSAVAMAQPAEDPWNFWIFRVRVGGDVSGEQRQSFFAGNGSLSANRTTEEWKIHLRASGWYSEDRFELGDGTELRSLSRSYGGSGFVAKSLGEHWGLAGIIEVRTSTFRNTDVAVEAGPGLEYNIFPYSESTHRELTITFAPLLNHFDYDELTIFGKTSETRLSSLLEVSYSLSRPFGSVNVRLEGAAFVDDPAQHSIELSSWLNVRLVRGLELHVNGRVERTKDQIFLPREGASDEEVLLRLRELGTDYRYRVGLSLSYTFGSIFNNVVNPRFD